MPGVSMISQSEQFELMAQRKGLNVFDEFEDSKFRFIWVSPKHREHAYGVIRARSFFGAFKKAVEVNDVLQGLEILSMRYENPMVFYGRDLVGRLTVMFDTVELSIMKCLRDPSEIMNSSKEFL